MLKNPIKTLYPMGESMNTSLLGNIETHLLLGTFPRSTTLLDCLGVDFQIYLPDNGAERIISFQLFSIDAYSNSRGQP